MKDLLKNIYDPQQFRALGHQLIDLLADHHEANIYATNPKTIPWAEPEDTMAFWNKVADNPLPPDQLFKTILEQSTAVHHPKYIGHQVGVSAPVSVLFGLLSSYLNNGMAVYEMGIAANAIEKWIINQLSQKLDWDEAAGGVLTSGGTLANLTALLTARRVKYDLDKNNKTQQLQPALMVSEQAHYSVDRAVLTMGWPKDAAIKIPVDEEFKMRVDLLEEYLAKAEQKGYQVIAVVGSACSTSTGSYDDLNVIADFCAKHDLWFHADGAHGACVLFSEKYAHLIDGINRADSVILDFHKMLMAPALATALLYKNNRHSFQTFQSEAAYLLDLEEDWYNTGKRTFECTKYMMGVKVFSIWHIYGEQAFAKYIDRCYDLAREFANTILTLPNFELATSVKSNIICFRWIGNNKTTSELNQINRAIRQELLEDGTFYIVQTTLRGIAYLRLTVMNPFTKVEDVRELLGRVEGLVITI